MRSYEAQLVLDAKAQVGESPRWDPRCQQLLWVDIHGEAVHLFDGTTRSDQSFTFGAPVGAAVLRSSGGYAVMLPGAVTAWQAGTEPQLLMAVPGESVGRRFNDAACDPVGRLVAGSMSTRTGGEGEGRLYCITSGGALLLREGIGLPNGIDWSPDGRTLYFTDSLRGEIGAFAYSADTGEIGLQTGALPVPEGLPDGHTVDAEGNIWVALWSAGRVVCVTPQGRVIASVVVPVSAVTSCTFGGPDLSVFYITTMRQPGDDESEPYAGGIFACSVGAVGRRPNLFSG